MAKTDPLQGHAKILVQIIVLTWERRIRQIILSMKKFTETPEDISVEAKFEITLVIQTNGRNRQIRNGNVFKVIDLALKMSCFHFNF